MSRTWTRGVGRTAQMMISASVGALALGAGAAWAQPPEATALEEIIVTAQKRGENLQSVPIAISAVTAESAEARGVTTTQDLQVVTPGLTIAHSGQAPAIFIRGIGTQNTTAGEESSNSVYVDGVYYSALPAALFSFNSIDRVEVLKGPQGTLFGRNATGGLIHVITRDPSFERVVKASLGVANYATVEGKLYISGPLSDTLAADMAYYGKGQDQGWGVNRFNGRDVYKGGEFAVRSKLLWRPSAATEVLAAVDLAEFDNSFSASSFVLPGAVGLGGQQYTGEFFDITSNLQPDTFNRSEGASVRVQHDTSWARLVSLSAYRKTKTAVDVDQDRVPLRLVDAIIRSTTDQFTQEFQIQSLPESNVSWILGAFFLDATARLEPLTLAGGAQAAIGGFVNRYAVQDTTSYAAFGQVTVPLGARTNVTAGLRYTKDKRQIEAYDITGLGPTRLNVVNAERSFSKPTWRLAVDHNFTDDVMVYASYSRGFKSGVYNLFAPTGPAVSPEVLDAYEVGFKSELLDRRLRLNASAFYYEYQNIQLLQAIAGGTRLLNAAQASVRGADFEAVAAPVRGLTLTAGLSLLDAQYDRFPNAPATFNNPATCTPTPTLLPGPRTGGNLTCAIDASGNQMIRAPDYTVTIGATYEWETSAGKFSANANYYRSADYPFEPDNRLQQPAYSLVNAQLGWRSTNDRYGLRVWGRNLGDEEYFVNLISSVGDVGTPAPPRTYGVTLDLAF